MSVALPSASSVRLLKLFPNDALTYDLNSTAASSSLSFTMTESHFFLAEPAGQKNLKAATGRTQSKAKDSRGTFALDCGGPAPL